jgi:hypothetical protein
MNRNLKICIAVFVVFSVLIQTVTLLNVLPAPKQPATPTAAVQPKPQATAATATNFNSLNVTGEVDAPTANVTTANITTGNVTTANITNLNQNGYANACAFTAGEASNVISGTTIAHGLGITPTLVQLTPEYSGNFTQTVYLKAHDAVSITVGISAGSVTTVTSVYWMACYK